MIFFNSGKINKLVSEKELISVFQEYHLMKNENEIYSDKVTNILEPALIKGFITEVASGESENQLAGTSWNNTTILFNKKNMKPLGLFDKKAISDISTVIACGLSIKKLTSNRASKLGIIAATSDEVLKHLKTALEVRPINELYLCNDNSEEIVKNIKKISFYYKDIKVKKVPLKKLVKESEIIITTAGLNTTLLKYCEKSDLMGKHIVFSQSINSEIQLDSNNLLAYADRIIIEMIKQHNDDKFESAQIVEKLEKYKKKVVSLKKIIRFGESSYKEKEFTIFISTNNCKYNLFVSNLIYQKYIEEKKILNDYTMFSIFDTFK